MLNICYLFSVDVSFGTIQFAHFHLNHTKFPSFHSLDIHNYNWFSNLKILKTFSIIFIIFKFF